MTEKKPTKAETSHAAKVSRNVYFVVACLVVLAVVLFGMNRCVA